MAFLCGQIIYNLIYLSWKTDTKVHSWTCFSWENQREKLASLYYPFIDCFIGWFFFFLHLYFYIPECKPKGSWVSDK